jgi:hypothetical protein
VASLKECARFAADQGVTLAVQNHHDVACHFESLRDLLDEVDSSACKAAFDAWSPALHGSDLVAAVRLMAPHIVHTTVADYVRRPRFRYQPPLVNYGCEPDAIRAVPPGEGFIDYRGSSRRCGGRLCRARRLRDVLAAARRGSENLDRCARGSSTGSRKCEGGVMIDRDRQRGMLVGLAIGDALGAAVEFEPPGSFAEVTGYRAGGPHGLAPGEWTDDTSMALALADSIAEVGWDLDDQGQRYLRWWLQGDYSVNGRCFDIGHDRHLPVAFENGRCPHLRRFARQASGNGRPRLPPVPIRYRSLFPADIWRLAEPLAESSLVTHASAKRARRQSGDRADRAHCRAPQGRGSLAIVAGSQPPLPAAASGHRRSGRRLAAAAAADRRQRLCRLQPEVRCGPSPTPATSVPPCSQPSIWATMPTALGPSVANWQAPATAKAASRANCWRASPSAK